MGGRAPGSNPPVLALRGGAGRGAGSPRAAHMARRALLAAAALAGAAAPAAAAEAGKGWKMRHHSFARTMSYDDTLGDWLSSAGTMALRNRVQLLPAVANRHGVLLSKQALGTRDFEARFSFSAHPGDINMGPGDAAVAFWVSPEDCAKEYKEQVIVTTSKDWLEGSKAAGLTLLQNRPTFRGLAVFLLGLDSQKSRRQSVATMWNDGKQVGLEDFVEGRHGTQTKFVDWVSGMTQVRVRVKPDGSIHGSMLTLDVQRHLSESVWTWKEDGVNVIAFITFLSNNQLKVNGGLAGSWTVEPNSRVTIQVNQLPKVTVLFNGGREAVPEDRSRRSKMEYVGRANPKGQEPEFKKDDEHWADLFSLPAGTTTNEENFYLGFSGWTGSASSIEVNLHELSVVNFDASKIGEEEKDVLGGDEAQKEWLQILEHERRFLDQASQTEAVGRLTKLLTEHTEKYNQLGEHLKGELVKLESRLDSLGQEINTYLSAAQAWVLETQSFNPQVVKDHIVGIRTALSKDKDRHDAALNKVNEIAAQLKAQSGNTQLHEEGRVKVQAVADLSKSVEALAEKGSMQTNGLLLLMVVSVAGLGLLFLSRMRYYEKKHYI
uniref:L-type lectin-like domain-containing protein n=1 Tax=Alexandrium monilatum TaxID=311494 RepID=A0A7S4UPR3_9DINO|mmetsp:Transcript_6297/g.20158  ORF Transcript_6297/g.20158 Transcript_6297/m.20158 type:complete len:604 (+) Transcript_6297:90-1901(+)